MILFEYRAFTDYDVSFFKAARSLPLGINPVL